MLRILILNGPNLNLLGEREPEVYGNETPDDLARKLKKTFSKNHLDLKQSNVEGELVNFLHGARKKYDGVVFNPGAYSHYSIALRDAVAGIPIPVVEVHLSNIYAREEFRKHSMIAPACIGQISGFGTDVYVLGVEALMRHLEKIKKR